MDKLDVLCAGIAVADVMAKTIDDVPEWNHMATFGHIEHHIGGCAVNTAVDLVRLGGRAGVSCRVGEDSVGDFVRGALGKSGVDTTGVVSSTDSATAYTFVMIGVGGRRRYLHYVGANACYTGDEVSDSLLAKARILHIGGTCLMPGMDGEPTARLLKRAQEAGLRTSLDTAFNPKVDANRLIIPCLPFLDIFIPSIEEAQAITGLTNPEAILDAIPSPDHAILGIKLGRDGCILRTTSGPLRLPIFKVEAMDESGAGDAFMAGFLYATLQGEQPEAAALMGNATAAFCIQAVGCSAGVRPAAEVRRFMESRLSSR